MNTVGVAVIVNPASQSGKSAVEQTRVTELAARAGAKVLLTEHKGHAIALARSLAAQGYTRVIAVGGDGTLSEVANGLAHSETALGAVPAGTGNDWVRTVGIPTDADVAWHIATHGRIVRTDLAEVVGHGYCLNVLGAGFDAALHRLRPWHFLGIQALHGSHHARRQ